MKHSTMFQKSTARSIFFVLAFALWGGVLSAQCVPSFTVSCPSDITVQVGEEGNLSVTGSPEVSGYYCDYELNLTYSDAVLGGGSCLSTIARTWVISAGDYSQSCTQSITIRDTQGPAISGLASESSVQCFADLPGFQPVTVTDNGSGWNGNLTTFQSQNCNGTRVVPCVASTAFGPGADWAFWLPSLSSAGLATSANYVFDANGGQFEEYADGTARVWGTVQNTANANQKWTINLWLTAKKDWAQWSALGRSYKNDLGAACATTNHVNWSYYELANGFSTATGAGAFAGNILYLSHMPANYFFGFQVGVGANNKNCNNGMSGWFTYNGFFNGQAINGHGDLNVDLGCEPEGPVNLQQPCSGCVSYFYRAIDNCGNATIFTQRVYFNDTTAPVFDNCPANITIECSDEVPAIPVVTATDNCAGALTAELIDNRRVGGDCNGSIRREWSVEDACGNSSNCVQIITIVDTQDPLLLGLPEATVNASCDNVPEAAVVTAQDNCSENVTVQYAQNITAGNCAGNYTITRTWTAYDDCENLASFTQTINVTDNTAPVFDAYEMYTSAPCDNYPGPLTATDNCSGASVELISESLNSGGCAGVLYRVYRATDGCGNQSTAEQFIALQDNESPTIDSETADFSVECGDEYSVAPATFSDNCDEELDVTSNVSSETDGCTTWVTYTWTAVDHCDNATTSTTVVTIVDATGPVFSNVPGDLTVNCDEVLPAVVYPTATDNCDDNVDVTVSISEAPGACQQERYITRTFTGVDNCNNDVVAVQTIHVVDQTAPVFGENAGNYTYECDETIPVIQPMASDNCSENLSYSFVDGPIQSNLRSSSSVDDDDNDGDDDEDGDDDNDDNDGDDDEDGDDDNDDNDGDDDEDGDDDNDDNDGDDDEDGDDDNDDNDGGDDEDGDDNDDDEDGDDDDNGDGTNQNSERADYCDRSFVRTWTVIDECGNSSSFVQTIRIVDTTAPVFVGESEITRPCNDYSGTYVTATDNCYEVTMSFTESFVNGSSCAGMIVRNYRAMDPCGNASSFTQYITLTDDEAPSITSETGDFSVECGDEYSIAAPTFSDNCDNELVITANVDSETDGCTTWVTYIWTATDHCDNSTTSTTVVTIVDTTNPWFTNFPADLTISCEQELPAVEYPTANDNCADEMQIFHSDEIIPGACANSYSISRMFRVFDNCGNSALETQTITVIDQTAPVFGDNASAYTYDCNTEIPVIQPGATDNCSENLTYSYADGGNWGNSCESGFTRTWTATDECGNSSTFAQSITIVDTTAPVIAGEINVQRPCGDYAGIYVSATDNCNEVTITYTEVEVSGSCAGSYLRTYTATDACGNVSATFLQIIGLVDDINPSIVSETANFTVECGDEYAVAAPSFSDNCDEDLDIASSESSTSDGCTTWVTYTWTATDHCDNSTTSTTIVTIVDTTNPWFENFPANTSVSCDEELPAVVYPGAYDACDNQVDIEYTSEIIPGSCPNSYTVVRTFRAYDNCSNDVIESQYITVSDETAPVFGDNASNYTYECNMEIPVITPGVADNCGEVTLSYEDTPSDEMADCGDFTTHFARHWGKANHPAGQYLAANFASAFPSGITVGCGENTLHFTSAAAVISYLPVPGQPHVLVGSDIDPNQSPNGLANQTIAALINVTFDLTDASFSSSDFNTGNLVYNAGTFAGMTVNEVIELANSHLGGCSSQYSLQSLRSALWQFNSAFAANNTSTGLFNCGLVNTICNQVISRVWTAIDECGNSSSFTQTINIVDTTAPIIAGENEIERPCDDYEGNYVTVSDNCNNWVVDYEEEMVSGSCAGSIMRTYTATDLCGNTSTFTQIIGLTDVVLPVIESETADFTVECDVEYNVAAPSFSDNCDNDLDITSDVSSSTDGCTTVVTYTWTATDHCGNSTTATTVVTIVDTTLPTFTYVPGDATYECTEEPVLAMATASDNCDSDVEVSVSSVTVAGSCPSNYQIIRTFTAVDNCGNPATAVQTITVQDTQSPVFGDNQSSFVYECSDETPVVTPSVSDACSEVTLTYSDGGNWGTTCNYGFVRTWTATDACGNASTFNQNISYEDTTAPVVNPYQVQLSMPCNEINYAVLISATDNCSEVNITYTDVLASGGCPGVIIRTYSISDECGNITEGSYVQYITLTDLIAPVVANAPQDVTIECGNDYPAYSPQWSDNCDDNLTITSSSSISVLGCTQIITEIYSAEDHCENVTTVTRTITIVDTTAPEFNSLPGNASYDCGDNIPVASVSASDVCDENVEVSYNDAVVAGDCPANYTIVRTWTAVDCSGNSATHVQYLSVSDTHAPEFGDNQSEFVYECGDNAPVVTPSVSDDCSQLSLSYSDDNWTEECVNGIVRTWTAVDACGNTSYFAQSIRFEDNTEPELSGCPSDQVLACTDELPAPAVVTVSDACDSDVEVVYEEFVYGDLPAAGSIADCDLMTPVRPANNPCAYPADWAMSLFGMPSAYRWYNVSAGNLVQYPNGTIQLTATLNNVNNAANGWNLSVTFAGGMNWEQWSSQGFPTGFKADCGGEAANHTDWTYFLMQAGAGAEMTGFGAYAGSALNLVHAPDNNYFGFQLGDGANNYNGAENGFGGWFSYNGTFLVNNEPVFSGSATGAGDLAFELDCCPDYYVVRQWTATDCSGNMSSCSQTITFEGSMGPQGMNDGGLTEATEVRTGSMVSVAPNPASVKTLFTFVPANTGVTFLEIYDITGNKVADVFSGKVDAGIQYRVDYDVNALPTGVYMFRMTNGSEVFTDRLIISK